MLYRERVCQRILIFIHWQGPTLVPNLSHAILQSDVLVLEENVPYFMKSGVCIRSSRKGEKEIKLQEKIKTKQS